MRKLKPALAVILAMTASGCAAPWSLRPTRVETLPPPTPIPPPPIPSVCRLGPATEPADPSRVSEPPPREAPEIDRLKWRLGVIEPRYQATRSREATNAERLQNCASQLPPEG